jgi:breast cancer 2 susceptibility protein
MPVFQIPKISTASAALGFTTASKKAIIMPSEEALAKAKAKLDAWNKEEERRLKETEQENICPPSASATVQSNIGFKPATSTPIAQSHVRPAFQTVSNIINTPGTPSPAGFSRPSANRLPTTNVTPNTSYRPKQFKPPMLVRQPQTPSYGSKVGSPLNPHRNTPSVGFASAASQIVHPLAAAPIVAPQFSPAHPSSSFVTPLRAKPNATSNRTAPAPFKTPFKSGMRPPPVPSTLGKKSQLSEPAAAVKDRPTQERPASNPPHRKTFFSMSKH